MDRRRNRGFSLIELLVVLLILGLLGGLVGPRLFSKVDAAKVDTAQTQVRMLKAALQTFRLDVGRYPSSEEGLNALMYDPGNLATWQGPYLDELLPRRQRSLNFVAQSAFLDRPQKGLHHPEVDISFK